MRVFLKRTDFLDDDIRIDGFAFGGYSELLGRWAELSPCLHRRWAHPVCGDTPFMQHATVSMQRATWKLEHLTLPGVRSSV